MALRIGDSAPDFAAETTEKFIRFHDWAAGNWVVLFSHTKDFTPVCTTELGMAARLKPEFDKRNVKVIALSIDSLYIHRSWIQDINETQGVTINFPIIADSDRRIAVLYDMIHPTKGGSELVRSAFIIGPDRKIKLTINYPDSTGRNFDEILRVIDSLQLTAEHAVATPVNWKKGEEVIILPSIRQEEIAARFPKGYTEIKSYLRTTPQPDSIPLS